MAEEKLQVWPTHWAGGWRNDPINRIHIEQSGVGVVGYVEHHGAGDGNDKYPTDEDYKRARLIETAWNACIDINPTNPIAAAEAMSEVVIAIEGMLAQFPEWSNHTQYCAVPDARLAIAKAKGGGIDQSL